MKGLFSSLEVMKDFKFAEICRYATVTNQVIYPFAVVMNMDRWNGLPKDVQKVMEDLKAEQAEWTGNYMDNQVKASIEWSKKTHQVEFITLSAAEKTGWDEKLKNITDKWITDNTAKGYPAQDIVGDIKALIKKHGG